MTPLYRLYRLGWWLARRWPPGVSYGLARGLAWLRYLVAAEDRHAVRRNLTAILGAAHPGLSRATLAVFLNFAVYLVDFFRLPQLGPAFFRRHVAVVGREHLDAALRQGRGVIILSAHLGNYELGAAAVAALGYPANAIVLTHQDLQIDAFFKGTRRACGVTSIPVGMALRQSYACLKRNELVGILGDRDFFNNGIRRPFLGRQMSTPKGPALLSLHTGALILPTFLIRDQDQQYTLIFDQPIAPEPSAGETREIERLTTVALGVLEQYIRRYPTQWYLFRDFDDPGPWVIL